MKRIGAIACLVAIMVMITSAFTFGASAFKVDETYPVDGQKSTTKENMCVKLFFNNEVGNDASAKANAKTFKITGPDGKQLPTIIMYNPDDATQAMVLVDFTKISATKILDDTEYTCTISKDFINNDGVALGKDQVITFKTMNQGRSTKIYMVMMVIMFGGIFFFTSRQAKKKVAEQYAETEKEEAFNPYKEAKKTGKSVEEIVAQHEKEMAKKEAKAARKAARQKAIDNGEEYEEETDNYRVKGPKPIAAAGSAFVTGRKALAEEKALQEAKRKAAANRKKKK